MSSYGHLSVAASIAEAVNASDDEIVSESRAPSLNGSLPGTPGVIRPNPFSTPGSTRPTSRHTSFHESTFRNSDYLQNYSYNYSQNYSQAAASGSSSSGRAIGAGRYFRSRRINKADVEPPNATKVKDPKEKWLWIIPTIGVAVGIAITGVLVYMGLDTHASHNYCPVLDDDFSSGTLNTDVWTAEIQVGGFGNHEFDQATNDPANLFIKDSQLHIVPTLQNETLMTTNSVVNLTAMGLCTSNYWADCVSTTNTTNGTVNQPVRSARINTKKGASIKYGRVEVKAKISQGDWLWPAIWMLPVSDTYGPWPASGEIDLLEARGNNHSYPDAGNEIASSALHWGPDPQDDAYIKTVNHKTALHSEYGDKFHVYGMEWTDKYLFTYIDTKLNQVMYIPFNARFWSKGNFPVAAQNGSRLVDPWSQTANDATPFDQEFYLIINLAVGGTNGWFPDGLGGKPYVDASPTARKDFWDARDQWYPTWQKNDGGRMVIDRVQMWQQC